MGKNKRKYAFGFSGKVSEKSKYEIPVSKASLFDLYPYFSFRYYHIDHNRFTHKGFSENDFNNFFERIHKNLGGLIGFGLFLHRPPREFILSCISI